MAWIESHQALVNHPKVLDLGTAMAWDLDTTLGKLHRFWWWCVDYAEDGDLRKHNDNRLGAAVGVLPGEPARRFVAAMVAACWLDRDPYFRVHDWWDYIGLFLQRKYGNKHPEKWQRVKTLYSGCTPTVLKAVQELAQPNQPNLTKPNQPTKRERAHKRFVPPTEQQVADYARTRDQTIDAARFCNYYASKGWTVGQSRMKDWHAAVRNWCGREKSPVSQESTDARSERHRQLDALTERVSNVP